VEKLTDNKNKISQRLQELRKNRKWTKTYVADMLGKTLSTYANYEYGTREPDADTLIKIAKLYNVSVGYILGLTDNPVEITKKEEEKNEFLKKIEDIELRKFIANIPNLPIEDLNKLYVLWKIIKDENLN